MKGFSSLAVVTLCASVVATEAYGQSEPDASPVPQKTYSFHFKQTSKDACVLQNGLIVFDPAGNATVDLQTMTTDDNDIWKSRIRLRSVAGTSVFTTPELNSPKMENKNGHPQTYNWAYSFHVDPTLLPSITSAEMFDIRC
jgi:hypothetical protein